MRRHERDLAVLKRLLDASQERAIEWTQGDHAEWFETTLDGRTISLRFLYFEATNQIGADRHAIDLNMPGLNARFFCGTEGYDLILDLLDEAIEGWRSPLESDYALTFLNEALTKRS